MTCEECGNELVTEEEKEVGLCIDCYDKYLENKIIERRSPDE